MRGFLNKLFVATINLMANQIISQILIYLMDFSKLAQKLTGNISMPSLSYSWLVVIFFVFAVLLIALSLGRSRMLLALLSLYVAVFLESHFVYFDKLHQAIKTIPDYWLHLGLFLLIYIIVFAILNRSSLKHRLTLAESSIFAVMLIALVEIGFLSTIFFSYFPPEFLKHIPSGIIPFFATKNAQFWWALVSLVALLLSKKKKEHLGI